MKAFPIFVANCSPLMQARLLSIGLVLLSLLFLSEAVWAFQSDASWSAESNQSGAHLGFGISTAGDVNGDGYSDVIVASPHYDHPQPNEGIVLVFPGGPAGLPAAPCCTLEVNIPSASFGWSLSGGDVNGDGYSDVLVGAFGYSNGQTEEGAAFLFLGSSTGLITTPAWMIESNQAGAWMGYAVTIAGDFNGDGRSDAVIGSPSWSNGQAGEGKFQVHLGVAGGLAVIPVATFEGNAVDGDLGEGLAPAGDVNGDGRPDLLVGAPYWDDTNTGHGRAYVYLASGTSVAATPALTLEGTQLGETLGFVQTAGDVNADGYSDFLVGAFATATGGRVSLYPGGPILSATPTWHHDGDGAGKGLSTAGDVNGDGYADVVVGSPVHTDTLSLQGQFDIYLGGSSGLGNVPVLTVYGETAQGRLGFAVATAGDVDGDGLGDVLVAAPFLSDGQNQEGRAYLYSGSSVQSAVGDDGSRAEPLLSTWPNPFQGVIHLGMVVNSPAQMSVSVFDMEGRLVTALAQGFFPSGYHHWSWNGLDDRGRPAPSGVYFILAAGAGKEATARVVLTR